MNDLFYTFFSYLVIRIPLFRSVRRMTLSDVKLYFLYHIYHDERINPYKYFYVSWSLIVLLLMDMVIFVYNIFDKASNTGNLFDNTFDIVNMFYCSYFSLVCLFVELRNYVKDHHSLSYLLSNLHKIENTVNHELKYPHYYFGKLVSLIIVYFILFILSLVLIGNRENMLTSNMIIVMSIMTCLYYGISRLLTLFRKSRIVQNHETVNVREPRIFTVTDILLLLCPLLLFFSRDFCIPCLLLSGLQICRMALREKRRGAPLLKTHWERLVIWKFMTGVFFILWGCVETIILIIG